MISIYFYTNYDHHFDFLSLLIDLLKVKETKMSMNGIL